MQLVGDPADFSVKWSAGPTGDPGGQTVVTVYMYIYITYSLMLYVVG